MHLKIKIILHMNRFSHKTCCFKCEVSTEVGNIDIGVCKITIVRQKIFIKSSKTETHEDIKNIWKTVTTVKSLIQIPSQLRLLLSKTSGNLLLCLECKSEPSTNRGNEQWECSTYIVKYSTEYLTLGTGWINKQIWSLLPTGSAYRFTLSANIRWLTASPKESFCSCSCRI